MKNKMIFFNHLFAHLTNKARHSGRAKPDKPKAVLLIAQGMTVTLSLSTPLVAEPEQNYSLPYKLFITAYLVNDTTKALTDGLYDIAYDQSGQVITTNHLHSRVVIFSAGQRSIEQVFQADSGNQPPPNTVVISQLKGVRGISVQRKQMAAAAESANAIIFFYFQNRWCHLLSCSEDILKSPHDLDFGDRGDILFAISSKHYEVYVFSKNNQDWTYRTGLNYTDHYPDEYPVSKLGPGRDSSIVAADQSSDFFITDTINNALIAGFFESSTNVLSVTSVKTNRTSGWQEFRRPSKLSITSEGQLLIPTVFNGFIFVINTLLQDEAGAHTPRVIDLSEGENLTIQQVIIPPEDLPANPSGTHQVVSGLENEIGDRFLYAIDQNSNTVNVYRKNSDSDQWQHSELFFFTSQDENQPIRAPVAIALLPGSGSSLVVAFTLSNQIVALYNSAAPYFDQQSYSKELLSDVSIETDLFVLEILISDFNRLESLVIELPENLPFKINETALFLDSGHYNHSNAWNFTASSTNSFFQTSFAEVQVTLNAPTDKPSTTSGRKYLAFITIPVVLPAALLVVSAGICKIYYSCGWRTYSPETPGIIGPPQKQISAVVQGQSPLEVVVVPNLASFPALDVGEACEPTAVSTTDSNPASCYLQETNTVHDDQSETATCDDSLCQEPEIDKEEPEALEIVEIENPSESDSVADAQVPHHPEGQQLVTPPKQEQAKAPNVFTKKRVDAYECEVIETNGVTSQPGVYYEDD